MKFNKEYLNLMNMMQAARELKKSTVFFNMGKPGSNSSIMSWWTRSEGWVQRCFYQEKVLRKEILSKTSRRFEYQCNTKLKNHRKINISQGSLIDNDTFRVNSLNGSETEYIRCVEFCFICQYVVARGTFVSEKSIIHIPYTDDIQRKVFCNILQPC